MDYADQLYALLSQENPSVQRVYKGVAVRRTVSPAYEPFALETIKRHLKLPLSATNEDTTLTLYMTAARIWAEGYTNLSLMQQTYLQTFNNVDRIVKLLRKPVLSVESVKIIANSESDTLTTVLSSTYSLTEDGFLYARSSWPSHRNFKSFQITFKTGFATLPDSPTEGEIATARAAIPSNIQLAMLNFIGHMYENREGQGPDSKYEVNAKLAGNAPQNAVLLLEEYRPWSV